MNYRALIYTAALICSAAPAIPAAHAQDSRANAPRAVVELFTSQGCSSCPAADKLLGELAKDPTLITLSLPVDYWDYLGWKDTLALHGHTVRQRAYSASRGDREVYTPQAVINGEVHALGSDKGAIEKAIASTRQNSHPLTIPVTLKVADGKINVTVAAADAKNGGAQNLSAEVWLCPTTNATPVAVGRGENSGRTVTYHNVVRRWIKLGTWSGKAENFSLPLSGVSGDTYALTDVDKLVVMVQSGVAAQPGVMLGVAQASLR